MGLFGKKKKDAAPSCCCAGACTPENLAAAEAGKAAPGVKVLGTGTLTKNRTVRATAFSASAKEKIEAAGGKVEVV